MEAGKSTIINELLSKNTKQYKRISTYTTRAKRPNEREDEQYHFISKAEYENLEKNGVLMAKSIVDGFLYRCTNN